jgi:hypothetical protein
MDSSSQAGAIGGIKMNSQKIAGTVGAIVAAAILALAFFTNARSGVVKPAPPQKVELPKVPDTPQVRGPVVKELPQ